MSALGRVCRATFEAAKREGFTELEAARAAAFAVVGIYNHRRLWEPARAAAYALEARELAADEGDTAEEQWATFAEAVAREPAPDDSEAARVAALERALGRPLPLVRVADGRIGRVLVEVLRREPPEPPDPPRSLWRRLVGWLRGD